MLSHAALLLLGFSSAYISMHYTITWAVIPCRWKTVCTWWEKIDKIADRKRVTPRGGRQLLPACPGRVFEERTFRNETRCWRLGLAEWTEKKEGWRFDKKYTIETDWKRNTGKEYMHNTGQVNYKLKKIKIKIIGCPAHTLFPHLERSQPSDINWRIKCFSSCGKVFHPETAIENLAKKSY